MHGMYIADSAWCVLVVGSKNVVLIKKIDGCTVAVRLNIVFEFREMYL